MIKLLTRSRCLAALPAAFLLGACETPPSTVTDLTEGQPVLKVVMATSGEATFPSGDVELSDIAGIGGFDTSVPDAFGRSSDSYNYDSGCPCWFYDPPDILGSDGPDQRPPAPSIGELSFGDYAGGSFLTVAPAGNSVADTYNWFGSFVSNQFTEGQQVWVGLARLGVSVAGDLDQNEILVGSAVASPDGLVYVGGSPGGDGGRRADEFNDGRSGRPPPFPAVPDANPYVMGYGEAFGGTLVIDFVHSSFDADGNVVYFTSADDFDQARAPVAGNGTSTIGDAQYNYMVFWDADPLTNANANVLFRIQMGADAQETSTTAQNNAFAPFPRDFVPNPTDLPGGTNAYFIPGTVTLSLTGLATLGGKQYTLWLYDKAAGTYALAENSEITIDGGEPIVGSSFDSPGPAASIQVDLARGTDFAATTHVVLSMEAGAAGSPTDTKFMFQEYLAGSGPAVFGGFTGGSNDYEFLNAGSGTAEFIVLSSGRRLRAELRRLPQPPQGFHYASYIVELIPSQPVTQYVRANDVTLDAVGNGQDIIEESQVGGFATYNTYVALLEPDGLQVVTPHFVQVSDNYQFKFVDFFPR